MGKHRYKHLYLILAVVIPTIVALAIYRDYLVGNNLYLYAMDDGFSQHLPAYLNYVNAVSLVPDLPWWNFSSGLGSIQSYDALFDPFEMIPVLSGVAFGETGLHVGFAWMQVIGIALAGLFAYLFLRKIKIVDAAALLGSVSYSLCGLIVLHGFWGSLAGECFIIVLLLYCVEAYFQDGKWWLVPPCVFLIGISQGMYPLFLYALLLCIYAIARFLYSGCPLDSFLKFMLKNIGLYILGVLASSIVLIGFGTSLFETARFIDTVGYANDSTSFGLVPPSIVVSAVSSLYDPNILGVFTRYSGALNYLERPLFYCGLLSLFLIPQAFALGKKRQRAILGFFFGLAFIYMLVPLCTDVFNAFIRNEELAARSYRLSSLWIQVLLIVSMAYGFHCIVENRKVNVAVLILTSIILIGVFTLLCFGSLWLTAKVDYSVASWVGAFLVLWTAVLALCKFDSEKKRSWFITQTIMICLLAFELGHSANVTINGSEYDAQENLTQMKEDALGYYGDVREAVDYIKRIDNGLYRISGIKPAPGAARLCAPLYFGINDTSYYQNIDNSTYRFMSELCPESFETGIGVSTGIGSKYSEGVGNSVIVSTLLGYKYHLAVHSDEELELPGYEHMATIGDIDILRNTYCLSFGILHNEIIPESVLQQESTDVQGLLLYEYASVEDSAIKEYSAFEQADESNMGPLVAVSSDSDALISTYYGLAEQLKTKCLEVSFWDRDTIEGKVTAETASILVFSTTSRGGWHARVDGEDASIQTVDYGLIGVEIGPGEHFVELSYFPEMLSFGAAISIGAICLYLILLFASKKTGQHSSGCLELI